ncbi:DUF1080 domain-containing protein [bacterium]|nr:MAG: DUF1080 domain-containing protein [bacterium]
MLAFAAALLALGGPQRSVLLFSKTSGFRHDSIPAARNALMKLGEERGWNVVATEDPAFFDPTRLSAFDSVVFLMTTGDVLNAEQEKAFESYVKGGGGYVGVHSAADTEYEWPWYGNLVGAYFLSHPAIQDATVRVEDKKHPSTSFLPSTWKRSDEWYDYRASPRGKVRVLASLDSSSYKDSKMPGDHPIMWCQETGSGRSWYTGMGHTTESYADPIFLRTVAEGIDWASAKSKRKAPKASAVNTLTPEERRAGWRLLFDGKSTKGWKNFRSNTIRPGWQVVNDVLTVTDPENAGDIVTDEKFGWFELSVDFKLEPGQNSGIMFHVGDTGDMAWYSGPEVQLYDHPAEPGVQTTGHLYELYPAAVDAARPAGHWNNVLIVVSPKECATYVNGVKYYDYVLNSPDFKARVAKSKFAQYKEFAAFDTGSIGIQGDHGRVSFRNVKVRKL